MTLEELLFDRYDVFHMTHILFGSTYTNKIKTHIESLNSYYCSSSHSKRFNRVFIVCLDNFDSPHRCTNIDVAAMCV